MNDRLDIGLYMDGVGRAARAAATAMAKADTKAKNATLLALARLLREKTEALQVDNAKDIQAAEAAGHAVVPAADVLAAAELDPRELTPDLLAEMFGRAEMRQLRGGSLPQCEHLLPERNRVGLAPLALAQRRQRLDRRQPVRRLRNGPLEHRDGALPGRSFGVVQRAVDRNIGRTRRNARGAIEGRRRLRIVAER